MKTTVMTTTAALLLATSAIAGEQPAIAGLRLGAHLGTEVPLCPVTPVKLVDCTPSYMDKLSCEKSNAERAEAHSEVAPPLDGSLCLGTRRNWGMGPIPARTHHWVVNPVKIQNLAVREVEAYERRLSLIALTISYGANETPRSAGARLTQQLNALTGREPRVHSDAQSCSGDGKNLDCYVNIDKEWETSDTRYRMRLWLSGGSLVASAKFGEPPPVEYQPLFTK